MDIDEILSRLQAGDVLMIDEPWRSYISREDDDRPARFVVRSIRDSDERTALEAGETPRYEEHRYRQLSEALLSLLDWKWQEKPQ